MAALIKSLIIFVTIACLNSSLVKAEAELEVGVFKLGVKIESLYELLNKPCRLMNFSEAVLEKKDKGQIKICTLRNDADLKIYGYKVKKAIFRFYDNELFHAAFDFKKSCKCFDELSISLASRYGGSNHSSLNGDLIRYERTETKITFHQLAGVQRLWWYNVPLLIEANSLIGSSNLVND